MPAIKRLSIVFSTLLILVGFASAQQEEIDLTPPQLGEFDPAGVQEIDLSAYPIMPEMTAHARTIYERGQAGGKDKATFSKVGDCMTANAYFMAPFGEDNYALMDYGEELSDIITLFGDNETYEGFNSFSFPGMATASGFTSASVLDPIWADPAYCSANESPLTCEYRITNPIFAIIMFGTNDVYYLDEASYDFYLRQIIIKTIQADVVPVLSTFPTRPEFPEKSDLYNQIIIKIAEDYELPLINLWLSIQDLPNQGIDAVETTHLSIPEDEQTGVFSVQNLQAGYTMRNLVTLQALDKLWSEVE